jgi:hypothetical protein
LWDILLKLVLYIFRDDAEVAEESHKLLVVGANPTPETKKFQKRFDRMKTSS